MVYINGRPIHPLVSFLVSVAVIPGMIGLGVLLLPVIGGIFLFVLLCVAAIALYGVYYRWRYGDPFKRAQDEMLRRMQAAAGGAAFEEHARQNPESTPEAEPAVPKGEARTGVRRTTVIEDAVVVEEVRRRGADKPQ